MPGFADFYLIKIMRKLYLYIILAAGLLMSCSDKYQAFRSNYTFKSKDGKADYADLHYWAAHPWKWDPSDSVPQPIAIVEIDHRDRPAQDALGQGRPLVGQADDLGFQQWTDLLERNGAGRQPCAGEGVDVAAVEGVAFLRAGATIELLVDAADSGNAQVFRDQRPGAVVRPDEVVAALRLQDNGGARGADARIDHRDEHGARRPERRTLLEPVGGLPDIVGCILVTEVEDWQVRINTNRHALHRRDGTVLGAKITLKDERMLGPGRRGEQEGKEQFFHGNGGRE